MSVETDPWAAKSAGSSLDRHEAPAPNPWIRDRPTRPQLGVPAPDRVDQLPVREQTRTARLWILGAHGGAGESTLAALAPDWASSEHAWPRPAAPNTRVRVILTVRSNMHGLRAAQRAATQWGSGLVPFADLVGLVVIADAPGRLPRALRDFAGIVAGGVPRTWHLPWQDSWRLGETPNPETAHRDVRALITDLTAITPGAPDTTNRKGPA